MDRIEAEMGNTPCPACQDRPWLRICFLGDSELEPDSCALCGRDFTAKTIWICQREDGPQ
jgi:hypothetical protein